jgi:tetratricopeptide (TPR) repeat protein
MHNSSNAEEMNRPLVSVIIPNYNHAAYIADAIQSMLAQDYRPIEVIVVDDGSTDNSRQVVAAFGDQVTYLWQPNQGLSAARNTGIRAAHGHYIGLLDADDLYHPSFLSTLVPMLEADVELGAGYGGYQFVNEHGQPLPQIGNPTVPVEEFYATMVRGNFLAAHCLLVRRSCYESVGPFDESLRASEDWDMWLRISQTYPVAGAGVVLVYYRALSGSMSSDLQRMEQNRIAVLQKHFGPLPKDPTHGSALQRSAYGGLYRKSAISFLQRSDYANAYRSLQKALSISPELVQRVDLFYEFGCGSQAHGQRGDVSQLDLSANAGHLFAILDRLFAEPDLPQPLRQVKGLAYANAHYALGLLYYGQNDQTQAQRHLWTALRYAPSLLRGRKLTVTLLKSLCGSSIIHRARNIRQSILYAR